MEEKQRNYTTWLVIIALLLLLNVAGMGYQFYTSNQRAKLVEEITALNDIQYKSILSLYDAYQDVAYGPKVDRIAEQQLVATEFTIQGLQIIAIQNQQIIELLSLSP